MLRIESAATLGSFALARILALASTLALCGPVHAAFDYELDVHKELNGLKLTAHATGGPMAKVVLASTDTTPAACRVEFISGREAPTVRTASIKKGKRTILTYSVPRGITALKVNVTCKPRGEASG